MKLKFREVFIFCLFVLFIALIVIHLFLHSICDWKGYRVEVEKTQERVFEELPVKGNFYDRNNRPLTQDKDVCWVFFDKKAKVFTKFDVPKNQCPLTPTLAINLLAKTLGKNPDELNEIISNTPIEDYYIDKNGKKVKRKRQYVCVAKNLDIKYLKLVNKLNYKGIFAEKRTMRYYPEGSLASRVLGITKVDGAPHEGLELKYASYTQGAPGKYVAQVDKIGRPILNTKVYLTDEKTGKKLKKEDGNNITLTIDTNIQYYAEKALNDMAAVQKPAHAMCIVMDPYTSEILAMANYPKLDPNNIKEYTPGMSQNFCVENMYEPGSTLKAFTVAMAVNEGYGADYAFGTCTNVISFGHGIKVKCDHGPHGACSPRNIIAKSCNIGAWYCTKKIGKETLYKYLNEFGVLGRPGEEFKTEAVGYIKNKPEKWVPVDACNYSFGQGMLTSCLAMANGYCVLANGGVYHTPKIIKEIKDLNGKVILEEKQDEGKRVISEATSKTMAELLAGCVNNGTGKPAKLPNCQAAGKTGSAQIFEKGKGYKSGKYLASFIGFAPAEKPELVVAVMVEYPKASSYGSVVAAPVWEKTMEKSLNYKKVGMRN